MLKKPLCLLTVLVIAVFSLSVAACEKALTFSYEGTVFTCNGVSHDLAAGDYNVNAVTGCTGVGGYVVVEGHISPRASYYGIYSVRNAAFEKEIIGLNLTYVNSDIKTIIYSSGADILDYSGKVLHTCVLSGGEYITWLAYSADRQSLYVEISSAESEATRTETFPII